VLLLIATVAWTPLGFGKGLILILFLLVTGPVIAHAISSAAYRVGVPMQNPVRDDLAAQHAMETREQARLKRSDAHHP
jgi:multicomponent Na+:H+ antiporter subunit G